MFLQARLPLTSASLATSRVSSKFFGRRFFGGDHAAKSSIPEEFKDHAPRCREEFIFGPLESHDLYVDTKKMTDEQRAQMLEFVETRFGNDKLSPEDAKAFGQLLETFPKVETDDVLRLLPKTDEDMAYLWELIVV